MAVKATNDFEQEMAKRFGGGGSGDSMADEVLPSAVDHAQITFVIDSVSRHSESISSLLGDTKLSSTARVRVPATVDNSMAVLRVVKCMSSARCFLRGTNESLWHVFFF